MTDRDRLIEDIYDWGVVSGTEALADRLIARGWTRPREPGVYPTATGIDVVVDVAESASWVEDEFPDEVAYIVAHAPLDEERLARALEAALPCEDPEEPCDADGREDHRWCDYCIARAVAGVAIRRIAKAYREDTE